MMDSFEQQKVNCEQFELHRGCRKQIEEYSKEIGSLIDERTDLERKYHDAMAAKINIMIVSGIIGWAIGTFFAWLHWGVR